MIQSRPSEIVVIKAEAAIFCNLYPGNRVYICKRLKEKETGMRKILISVLIIIAFIFAAPTSSLAKKGHGHYKHHGHGHHYKRGHYRGHHYGRGHYYRHNYYRPYAYYPRPYGYYRPPVYYGPPAYYGPSGQLFFGINIY